MNATTLEELDRLKHSVALLSPKTRVNNYLQSREKCRLDNGAPRPPRFVQELVPIWRVLWRWSRSSKVPGFEYFRIFKVDFHRLHRYGELW